MDMKFADTVEMVWRQFKTGWQAGADIPLTPDQYTAELKGEEATGPRVGNAPWQEDEAARAKMIQTSHDDYAKFYRRIVLPWPLPMNCGADYIAWYKSTHPNFGKPHAN